MGQGREGEERGANDARLTTMIHIHQITVQIHMLISARLHRCISRLFSLGARWEGEFRVDGVGREVDQGDGLGGELVRVRWYVDPWDGGVGRLSPVGG